METGDLFTTIRDIDHRISELESALKLHAQREFYFRRDINRKITSLESKFGRRKDLFAKIWETNWLKIGVLLTLLLSGKPLSEAIMAVVKIKL